MKPLIRAVAPVLAAFTLAAGLSGCAWSIGDKDGNADAKHIHPTKGAELSDLKRAYDDGAITEQEYKDQKQRVLDRP